MADCVDLEHYEFGRELKSTGREREVLLAYVHHYRRSSVPLYLPPPPVVASAWRSRLVVRMTTGARGERFRWRAA